MIGWRSRPIRAAIFLGAHVVALFIVWIALVRPIAGALESQNDEIQQKAELIARMNDQLDRFTAQARAETTTLARDRSG